MAVVDLWEGKPRSFRDAARARGDRRWEARYRDGEGKQKRRRFHTRVEASDHLDANHRIERVISGVAPDALAEMLTTDYLRAMRVVADLRVMGDLTVEHAVEVHLHSKRNLAERGLENAKVHAGHVVDALGERPVHELTKPDIEDWLTGINCAPSSKTKRLAVLRSALRHVGQPDPSVGVTVRQETQQHVFLTLPELVDVAKASRFRAPIRHQSHVERPNADVWETLILVMGVLGLRVSEALGLRVRDVEETALFIAGTKTAHSRRRIPLPKEMRTRLLAVAGTKDSDRLLFTTGQGTAIPRERVGDRVREASERVLGKKIRPHDLRHTAAAHIIERGGIPVASKVLGHASPAITAALYGNVTDSSVERTMKSISGVVDEMLKPPAAPHLPTDPDELF